MGFAGVLTVLLIFCEKGQSYISKLETPPELGTENYVTEYTLYEKKVNWNDAARICALEGGHMLTIKTQEKHRLIESFKDFEWDLLITEDYWTGLSEPSERYFIWNDCTVLSTSFNKLKGENYKADELCYLSKKGYDVWESKKCQERHYFACEKVITGVCEQQTILRYNILASYTNMTESDCQDMFLTNSSCWSGIYTNYEHCILLAYQSGGEVLSNVAMFRKTCARVVPEANAPFLTEDKDIQPLLNCSLSQSSPNLPAFSSITIEPSPCYEYETVNITYVHNVTEIFNITTTQTVNITTPIHETVNITYVHNVTETFIITTTQTVNITTSIHEIVATVDIQPTTPVVMELLSTMLVITSTVNVTETYNVTEYFNHTTTISESQCSSSFFNVTKQYTSPSDPTLVEAIASMKKELTVDKKTTKSHIRTLTSAEDKRESSRNIGMAGVVLLVVPLAIIFLSDITNALRGCASPFKKYRD